MGQTELVSKPEPVIDTDIHLVTANSYHWERKKQPRQLKPRNQQEEQHPQSLPVSVRSPNDEFGVGLRQGEEEESSSDYDTPKSSSEYDLPDILNQVVSTVSEIWEMPSEINWNIMVHPNFTGKAEAFILMFEDLNNSYVLVKGEEYIILPVLSNEEGTIGESFISALMECNKIYKLTKSHKKTKLIRRTCHDVEEIWNAVQSSESGQQVSENMEVLLDTLEGLKVAKGQYLLGKRPVVADYFVLALILLLRDIYGDQLKKTLETKIVLRKWVNLITHRSNIMSYLQRERKLPIIDWKWN